MNRSFKILIVSFLGLSGCAHMLEEDMALKRLLTFEAQYLEKGMSRDAVASLLGNPEDLAESPYGRELWVYTVSGRQITYSNALLPRWYLFDEPSQSEPKQLTLTFDECGALEGLSYRKEALMPVKSIANN